MVGKLAKKDWLLCKRTFNMEVTTRGPHKKIDDSISYVKPYYFNRRRLWYLNTRKWMYKAIDVQLVLSHVWLRIIHKNKISYYEDASSYV